MNDVIVVLPGILGSVLQKNGKDIWALSPQAIAKGIWTTGDSIKDLELKDDSPLDEDLKDGVTAPRILPDLHLIPGLWKIDGYSRLVRSLKNAFQIRQGANYFEFPYDWRRDNRSAAHRLKRMSDQWLKDYRTKSPEAKLVLIAHSMGGLVSRYFLECLGGWKDTRALITFGTPHRGSLKAVDFIANGYRKKVGPLTLLDLTELLRSLTSVYQLLPIYECYDPGNANGALVKVAGAASIPNLDQKRVTEAMDFHEDIQKGVTTHAGGYAIHSIVGTHQETFQSARLDGATVRMLTTYKGQDQSGDGTVPRVSASPIELGNSAPLVFAACPHASLQNDEPVWINLEGILTGMKINLDEYRERVLEQVNVGLSVEDVYPSDQPVAIRARPEKPIKTLQAQTINAATQEIARADFKETNDGWMTAIFEKLGTGAYRVKVSGEDNARQARLVADAFAVV